jgi:acyl dehydratase
MKKVITLEDVPEYIDITEDRDPIYIDESYCCRTEFKKPIVPPP